MLYANTTINSLVGMLVVEIVGVGTKILFLACQIKKLLAKMLILTPVHVNRCVAPLDTLQLS